ncbi:MAG TPA: M28 family peptidase [Bacteroidia bacterium]|nr:M28 family peptidase [Bacteroidia bacterium]
MSVKKISLFFPIAFLLLAFTGGKDPVREKYAALITAEDMKTHLSVIASDEYEGRETAMPGQKKAAEYIAKQFASFGIPPYANGSYFQDVPLIEYRPSSGSVTTPKNKYEFGKDFFFPPSDASRHEKCDTLVFLGYGIDDPAYNDYANTDVSGKAVLIMDGEPKDRNGNNLISGSKAPSEWYVKRAKKVSEAQKHNAGALLIVVDEYDKALAKIMSHDHMSMLVPDEENDVSVIYDEMPVLLITRSMADNLLKEGKQTPLEKLVEKISGKKKPVHTFSKMKMDIVAQSTGRSVHSENVLGYLEGSDLKGQLVVITAHYDHLGKDSVVYNGADDDGSGTVSIIELAKAFAQAKKEGHGPRRSILFMTMTGEEKGLLGSSWYTSHPVFPLDSTVCDLNIDMIGRIDTTHAADTNYVYVIGSGMISAELKTINETENNTYTGLSLDYRYDKKDDPNRFYYRSDHYNFAKNGIPVAFFFNGVHPDYHRETDEVQKIHFPLMEKRAQLVFYTAWEIANRNERLKITQK